MKRQRLGLAFSAGLLMAYATSVLAEPNLEEAWIRLMPSNAHATAAYANISSEQADRLLSVETDIAEKAEIHETKMENGMMSMRPLDAIEIKADAVTVFEPQGKHIMLMGLKRPLEEGEEVVLALEFAESGIQTYTFTVRKP